MGKRGMGGLETTVSMTRSLQRIKGGTTAALVTFIASYGAGILLGVGIGTPREQVGTRPDDSRQTKAVPSERLAGVVRDDEGRPLAGATVVAGQFRGGKPNHRIGTTRSDGRFEFTPTGESAHLEYVVVHKEGLAPASILRLPRDDKAQAGDVVLQLSKPMPFVGVVRNRGGKPVAGATVRIQYAEYPGWDGPKTRLNVIEPIVLGTSLENLFRTSTDSQGQFLFPALPRDMKASLVVRAAGMGEYNTMNRRAPDGQLECLVGTAKSPAEVVLAPAARVAGRVVSRFPSVNVGGLSCLHARLARVTWYLGRDQDRR